jgi:hypothetical protein
MGADAIRARIQAAKHGEGVLVHLR